VESYLVIKGALLLLMSDSKLKRLASVIGLPENGWTNGWGLRIMDNGGICDFVSLNYSGFLVQLPSIDD